MSEPLRMTEEDGNLDLKAFLAKLAATEEPPANPSKRTPDTDFHSNKADCIEQHLELTQQHLWGFVIYRTTYESDADWTEFLHRLRVQMEDLFKDFNGQDILDLFALTVFDDPASFADADTKKVRQHFNAWAEKAPEREQHSAMAGLGTKENSPRYWYAIQVNKESLASVVHGSPEPPDFDYKNPGWVMLIDRIWKAPEEYQNNGSEHGADLHCGEEYELIDGVSTRNVGWVKVAYRYVMTDDYVRLAGTMGILDGYLRPPQVNV